MAALPLYFDTQFYTSAGVPAALHLLYTYESGTTTPLETYTDATGDTANANPITLDSAGRANLWIGNRVYALELKTPAGVLVKQCSFGSPCTATSRLALLMSIPIPYMLDLR